MSFHINAQIHQQLLAGCRCVRKLCLSQHKHSLEFSVVGIVMLIEWGFQIKIFSTLPYR